MFKIVCIIITKHANKQTSSLNELAIEQPRKCFDMKFLGVKWTYIYIYCNEHPRAYGLPDAVFC